MNKLRNEYLNTFQCFQIESSHLVGYFVQAKYCKYVYRYLSECTRGTFQTNAPDVPAFLLRTPKIICCVPVGYSVISTGSHALMQGLHHRSPSMMCVSNVTLVYCL
jgi:hypothetical protein